MDNKIKRTLLETGLPWRTVSGRRGNVKIYLKEKLVGVTTNSSNADNIRGVRNVQAQIRPAARELKGDPK